MSIQKNISIVIEDSNKKTSIERNLELIKQMEIQFNTGPIIGEAFELLYHMAENIMIRDLMLFAIGLPDNKKEKMFVDTKEIIEKMDEEILEKRKEENG